jgi:hypothetical protein
VTVNSGQRTLAKGGRSEVMASCPAPKTVVGGGVAINNPNFLIAQSIPFGAAWDVVVLNGANNSQTGSFTAVAICAIAP